MKILLLLFFLYFSTLNANELSKETSPYLLQHATNPVNWMPWSARAFAKAKRENKPLFVSIGYSTCHWCHMMEKESFTDKKIAAQLNKYFISIKVDREELPQIDVLYQNIYKSYKKHSGGWPLNLFMTADKKVFYISTYISPVRRSYSEGFDTLLPKLHKLYSDKSALKRAIEAISHPISTKQAHSKRSDTPLTVTAFSNSMKELYNTDYPGFGNSKQFPEASKMALMLELAELSGDVRLKKEYFTLLDTMALSGLYDQIDGGFFRYSVDLEWEIPHFEKMLYTQAELLPLYVRGYELTKKKLYKSVVEESIAMLEQRFGYKNLYFSASDADSKKEEGGYFIFTKSEVQKALQSNPHAKEIEEALGFTLAGNMRGKIHLSLSTDKRPEGFKAFQKALQRVRATREYPFIDQKINTAWNAMMIEALYDAAYIDKKYAKKADAHLQALQNLMLREGELYHQTVPKHTPTQKGLLEDYAFFISALIASYENGYDTAKLSLAEYLLSQAQQKFYQNSIWYMSEAKQVRADLNDKYYTSALSKIVEDTIKLSALKESFHYEKLAQKSIKANEATLKRKLAKVPALAHDYLMLKKGVFVLKSNKDNLVNNMKTIKEVHYPYLMTLQEDYDDYLVCTLRKCFLKSADLNAVIQVVK